LTRQFSLRSIDLCRWYCYSTKCTSTYFNANWRFIDVDIQANIVHLMYLLLLTILN